MERRNRPIDWAVSISRLVGISARLAIVLFINHNPKPSKLAICIFPDSRKSR